MGDYIKRTLALDMIDEMPRADVQKVKHGKWIIKSGIMTKYCPNCGAKMDKGSSMSKAWD